MRPNAFNRATASFAFPSASARGPRKSQSVAIRRASTAAPGFRTALFPVSIMAQPFDVDAKRPAGAPFREPSSAMPFSKSANRGEVDAGAVSHLRRAAARCGRGGAGVVVAEASSEVVGRRRGSGIAGGV
jgi:hypothetical protein